VKNAIDITVDGAATALRRVVVDREGYAVSPTEAVERYGVHSVAVIFVRNDGWTLGASKALAHVAHSIWDGHWGGFFAEGDFYPICLWEYYRKFKPAPTP
jgi:hypothetical protein